MRTTEEIVRSGGAGGGEVKIWWGEITSEMLDVPLFYGLLFHKDAKRRKPENNLRAFGMISII
eukprot:767668-Hanusia_phi.AAC.5